MLTAGLTGGLASGKSFVGAALGKLGCQVIKADELGHEVLRPGGEAYEATVAEFGREILDEDGAINRRRLASLVFSDPQRLALLNSFVHPAVFRREEALAAQIGARDPQAIAVVEAAILVETGSYRRFDRLVVAVCTREQQIQRAMKRDGLSRSEVETRLNRQLPLEEKVKVADYIVDTSGAKESTLAQVADLYRKLRGIEQ